MCDAAFPSHHQLVRHRSIHFHGQHKQNLKCGLCDKLFLSEGLLKRHQMADGHRPSAVLRAPSAPAQRSEEEEEEEGEPVGVGVEVEVEVEEEPPLPPSCSFCSAAFESQAEMSGHLRSKRHVNTLERLGMLPVGTYERLSEDQAVTVVVRSSPLPEEKAPGPPLHPHPHPHPPLPSLSVSQDAAYLLDRHFSTAHQVVRAAGNVQALSKMAATHVPKTGTPVREILSTLRQKESMAEEATVKIPPAGSHHAPPAGSNPSRGSLVLQHESQHSAEAPRGAAAAATKRNAASLEDAVRPRVVVVVETSAAMDSTVATRSEDRSKFASSKKRKLQNAVLHSIDSDPDGDFHLVIDEGQGDVVLGKEPEESLSVVSASAAAVPLSPSSAMAGGAGGGGVGEEKGGDDVKQIEEEEEEEEAVGGSPVTGKGWNGNHPLGVCG